MAKNFEARVRREIIVDTRKYRYIEHNGSIYRIELDKLDTTAVLHDWQLIK